MASKEEKVIRDAKLIKHIIEQIQVEEHKKTAVGDHAKILLYMYYQPPLAQYVESTSKVS